MTTHPVSVPMTDELASYVRGFANVEVAAGGRTGVTSDGTSPRDAGPRVTKTVDATRDADAAPGRRRANPGERSVIACDLDRTLIYSAKALALAGDDADAPVLLVAEVYDKLPLSYLTVDAVALVQEMHHVAHVVPATTRTRAQYGRIRLPIDPHFAITTNGAHLLVDGVSDEDYHCDVVAELDGSCAPLAEIREYLDAIADPGWLRKLRDAEGMFAYLVVERAELPASVVRDLSAWADERGWDVSLQGRKLYVVPKPLRKSRGLAEVMRRTGATFSTAAGDSLLDADLLLAVDAPIRPRHGELDDLGWTCPGLQVTTASGVLGGREVCARLLAAVSP